MLKAWLERELIKELEKAHIDILGNEQQGELTPTENYVLIYCGVKEGYSERVAC